ncbi:hypothetical protein KHS38_02880 [Mucilaginibacter sp. Bleaf8]|uniref:hypothetical protein n=1 Tax=Mucilaginibacter sp. Bleaf8 TaxID=2834430 RepID=UPI001BD0591E|nr:hypothetical protein [Mucilaginibacter sp. Bleaf8]MBS7563336.1 hypothetical protein [Mucilaginibacter sp. Bleaf8]
MRSYGLPQMELCFVMEMTKRIRNIDKNNWILPTKPFCKLVSFNRSYDENTGNYKLQKLTKLVEKLHPVELASSEFTINENNIVSSIKNYESLLFIRDTIRQLFNIRQYDNFDETIYLKKFDSYISLYSDINNVTKKAALIWTTKYLKLYQRLYISNKHWEAIPKYRLAETWELKGQLKQIDLESTIFKAQHNSTNKFPKHLFDGATDKR